MTALWNWTAHHWATWLIPFVTWIFGNVTGGVFIWFYPNRKEWAAQRKEKTEPVIDIRVLEAMGDAALWKGPRPMTGAGIIPVKSDEMADHLKLDRDVIADSFERLEAHGKAKRSKGSLNDPTPWWLIIPR